MINLTNCLMCVWLQIRSDVERQGDFIRFLIKEVDGAAFADIDDVVTFVKWLDVELSRLVRTNQAPVATLRRPKFSDSCKVLGD